MRKISLLFIAVWILLVGCSNNDMKIYKGRDLKIAVIGAIPEVREENITFKKITLEDLQHNTDNLSNEVDAIMIMKEFLHEADDDQYVAAYRSLKIPIFFMQSTKVHVPFVNEGVRYDDIIEVDPANFATGFLDLGTDEKVNEQTWRYKPEKKQNNQDVYSRIFATIESVSN
ncbi:hypothetical protein ACIQXI_15830 [Lysinibacillus sp. NPDC097195]|uniref:hypothetical protein n=1 Tax=Lysinibacillus sp. NPDC097195 TaxID=3364141 RepID=UPI0038092CFE